MESVNGFSGPQEASVIPPCDLNIQLFNCISMLVTDNEISLNRETYYVGSLIFEFGIISD